MKLRYFALLTVMASGLVYADANTPRIDARQDKQDARIEQGVASGQLTNREAAHLEKREAGIANAEAKAKADGKVTRKERAHLRAKENRTSKAIYQQKHDRQHD